MNDKPLTLIDPNDNGRARHQYRVSGWTLQHRRLPPASVGDRWLDDPIDEPWWEPVMTLPVGGPIRAYYEAHASVCLSDEAYTESMREAREAWFRQ